MASLLDPRVTKIISAGLGRGLSANAIWRSLPGFNLPKFHRQTFLGRVRSIGGFVKLEHQARRADPYEMFPKGSMVETPLSADVRYRTYFDLQMRDRTTGELLDKRTVSMYHDNLLSPDQWESDFISKYRGYWGATGIELDSIVLKGVEHFQGRPY